MKKIRNAMFRCTVAVILCLAVCFTTVAPCLAAVSFTGDINGDGIVAAGDLILIRTALLNGDNDGKYDINENGEVNILDLIRLKKLVANFVDGQKFASKVGEEYTVYSGLTLTVGDIFEVVGSYEVDSADVNIEFASDDCTYDYVPNYDDWTLSTVTPKNVGIINVVIYDQCVPTSITLNVELGKVFAANAEVSSVYSGSTVMLCDLFTHDNGFNVDSEKVVIEIAGDVESTLTQDKNDWTKSTITFKGEGDVTVSIKETALPTETAQVSFAVELPEAFTAKDASSVYSGTVVLLGDLFEQDTDVDVNNEAVEITATSDKVNCVVTKNTSDWKLTEIFVTGAGRVNVTINETELPTKSATAYFDVALPGVFTSVIDGEYSVVDGTTVKFGDIFTQNESFVIDDSKVELSVSSDSVEYVIDNTAAEWENRTVTFSGVGSVTVSIVETARPTEKSSVTFSVTEKVKVEKFDVKFENVDKYLYRVGNVNTVELGSLFAAKDGVEIDSATVVIETESANGVTAVYTANSSDWTLATVKFTGVGVTYITITADSLPTTLAVEVIDAANVTSYSNLSNRNSVLLNDITMSSNKQFYLSNATLYGNGFTFDVTKGLNTGNGEYAMVSNNYLVCLSSAKLDNVEIIGAVYTAYGATAADSYNNPVILSGGNSTIANSLIANCASPVRVRDGKLYVVNSTLKGGNYANMDIRGGNITLENVTTINQVADNDTATDGSVVAGLGIMFYYENVLPTTTLEINGTFTQYNNLCSTDEQYIKSDEAQSLFSVMFTNQFASMQYTDANGNKWVNAGIVSMSSNVTSANIIDNRTDKNYRSATTSLYGNTGYVYTPVGSSTMVAGDYVTAGQYEIAPSYSFDYTTKNYVEKVDGSNDYCYYDSTLGSVVIAFDAGNSFSWDTSILTATKVGNTLDYTVAMNGTDYTGKSITFSEDGNYVVEYTYSDPYNYTINANGEVETYSKTYTKTVNIAVSAVKPSAKNAEFTFGSSGTASKTATINNNTYVMPNVTTDNSKWGSITVGSEKVTYPIVEATIVSKKTAYFNVFKNVVTITDYADSGTGAAVTYGSSTTTMPSGLTVVKGKYGAFADLSSNWSNLTDSALTQNGASNVFKYAGSASASSTPTTYSGALCFKSPDVTNARDEYYTIAQYSYTDNAGKTYYYYVGYHMAAKGDGGCVTGDTLITLADGSKKQVKDLTGEEMLLVFNHETGKLDSAPVAYIVDHNGEVSEREIIHLYFSDGSHIKMIEEHVFFDATLNKYVALDADAADYIGHRFAVLNSNGDGIDKAELVRVEKETKLTDIYEVVTYKNITCFTDNILSASAYLDKVLNIFDIDPDTMAYDPEKVAEDIEKYGLYTYADFEGLIEEEAFELYNAQYLKVAVGKGYITWDDILSLIDIYFGVEVDPLA